MMLLPFHCATTGMIQYKDENGASMRSNDPRQPHIVSLSALIVDSLTMATHEELDVIIKPDGWQSEPGAADVHRITHERAMDEGIPEADAIEMFIAMWNKCNYRIAHNTNFDNRIIRIALKRFSPDAIPDEVWKDKDLYYSTMAKKVIQGASSAKLEDVYRHFTGNSLQGTSTTMRDTRACLEIYLKQQS